MTSTTQTIPRKAVRVHVFDNYGHHHGTVVRLNHRGRRGAPIVRVSRLFREADNISGYGWSIHLGAKAKLPRDLKPARPVKPARH